MEPQHSFGGWLEKQGNRFSKAWKKRYFFLAQGSTTVSYYADRPEIGNNGIPDVATAADAKGTFDVKDSILRMVEHRDTMSGWEFDVRVEGPKGARVYVLRAETKLKRDQWASVLLLNGARVADVRTMKGPAACSLCGFRARKQKHPLCEGCYTAAPECAPECKQCGRVFFSQSGKKYCIECRGRAETFESDLFSVKESNKAASSGDIAEHGEDEDEEKKEREDSDGAVAHTRRMPAHDRQAQSSTPAHARDPPPSYSSQVPSVKMLVSPKAVIADDVKRQVISPLAVDLLPHSDPTSVAAERSVVASIGGAAIPTSRKEFAFADERWVAPFVVEVQCQEGADAASRHEPRNLITNRTRVASDCDVVPHESAEDSEEVGATQLVFADEDHTAQSRLSVHRRNHRECRQRLLGLVRQAARRLSSRRGDSAVLTVTWKPKDNWQAARNAAQFAPLNFIDANPSLELHMRSTDDADGGADSPPPFWVRAWGESSVQVGERSEAYIKQLDQGLSGDLDPLERMYVHQTVVRSRQQLVSFGWEMEWLKRQLHLCKDSVVWDAEDVDFSDMNGQKLLQRRSPRFQDKPKARKISPPSATKQRQVQAAPKPLVVSAGAVNAKRSRKVKVLNVVRAVPTQDSKGASAGAPSSGGLAGEGDGELVDFTTYLEEEREGAPVQGVHVAPPGAAEYVMVKPPRGHVATYSDDDEDDLVWC